MSIKLDLSQFKHIRSDKNSSTLQHKQGHMLTIAHAPLTKESKAQLEALAKLAPQDQTPIQQDEAKHQSGQKMADGGDVQPTQQPVDRTKNIGGGTVKGASGADITSPSTWFAQGGKVAKYCQYCGGSMHTGECSGGDISAICHIGGNVADSGPTKRPPQMPDKPSGNTLNYPAMKKEYLEKNKPKYGEHNQKRQMYADGAHEVHGNYDTSPQQEQSSADDAQIAASQAAQDYQDKLRADRGLPPMNAQPQQTPAPGNYVMAGDQPAPPQSQDDQSNPQNAQSNPQQMQAMDSNSPAQAVDTPQQAPQAGAQPPPVQQQPKTLQDHAMDIHKELAGETQAMQQDMANGHITPKTYSDLFHYNQDGSEKSTLGKISTAFGMLLAGAGSGLAHQPNAMLNMMDKYIENDLNAQQKSNDNRMNFLKINQQDMMNKSQIPINKATAASMNLDNQLKSFTQGQIVALDRLTREADQMPDGPKKQEAMQQLAMMNQGIQAGLGDWKSKAIAAGASARMMMGQNLGGAHSTQDPEQAFKLQQGALWAAGHGDIATKNEQHHLPGYTDTASGVIPQETKNKVLDMNILDNRGKDLLSFIKQHSGTWNPQTREQAAQKAAEIHAYYNNSFNGGALTQDKREWYDSQFAQHPTDLLKQWMGNTKRLEEMVSSNKTRRDGLVKSTGIDPNTAYGNPIPSQAPQEGQSMMSKSGRPITYSNGQWNYK